MVTKELVLWPRGYRLSTIGYRRELREATMKRRTIRFASAVLCVACFAATHLTAQESVDHEIINKIRYEGFHNSEVMEIARKLTEELGPRLTGSPNMKRANEWTRDTIASWGLDGAHLESFEFGRGWSFSEASIHMLSPAKQPLSALPKAWTPGTTGAVRGEAMRVDIDSAEDLEKYRGKVAGKILFTEKARTVEDGDDIRFRRHTDDGLEELTKFPIPGGRDERAAFRERFRKRYEMRKAYHDFLTEEGVLATVELSSRDYGIIRVTGGGSREPDENPGVTVLAMATEHYNRVVRHIEAGETVELEIRVDAQFHDEDLLAYNTVGEIPGSDLAHELVMVGAHLDSWHAGVGATDNAAGSAVALEAIRILTAIGAKPRRTVRVALWSGEEQGLIGSREFVSEHFASRPIDPEQKKLPRFLRDDTGPLTIKPAHEDFSVYFNLDNGSGRIRGVYAQENAAVVPIFQAWLEPFHDLGATTVSLRNTGGTDHLSFDAVGLPGFQFIQDRLDYQTRTHHTHLDTFDHLREDDLKQASVIMASFLYHAAMRDEKMPRKPVPKDTKKASTEND
jgi:hypothetical protein